MAGVVDAEDAVRVVVMPVFAAGVDFVDADTAEVEAAVVVVAMVVASTIVAASSSLPCARGAVLL